MKYEAKKRRYAVTLALSAFNEEKNIVPFLKSVLKQKETGFILKEIWVHSDGSTDDTVKNARSVKSSKIKVFDSKTRIGKSSRLNVIYKALKSDFLVQSDADVVFVHPFVIRNLIQPLIDIEEVAMCGGHPQPVNATTFVEKAVNSTFDAYVDFRSKVRGGDNVFSVDGRLLAYKRKLVKKIYVPADMIANDAFTYYSCLSLGFQYSYVESAKVWFRSPKTLKDQIRQNTRFESAELRMDRHFDPELVRYASRIPKMLLLKNTLIQFAKHPILCGFIFVVNQYCRIRAKTAEKHLTAKWPMAFTTKKIREV